MRLAVLVTGVVLFFAGGVTVLAQQSASSPDLLTPDWVHYVTVERSDGSFRRMYVSHESLQGLQPGGALPDGTIIAMETFYGPESRGQTFIQEKQNGRWLYGSFSPGRPDFMTRARPSCRNCHRSAEERDNVFTLPSLWRLVATQETDRFSCNRSGRSPCDAELYQRRYVE